MPVGPGPPPPPLFSPPGQHQSLGQRKDIIMPAKNTTAAAAAEFDLDAILGAAEVPTSSVKIYTRGPLLVELDQLLEARREEQRAQREQAPSPSWGDPDVPVTVSTPDLDAKIEKARAELNKSAIQFVVRSLDSDDGDQILRRYPDKRNASPDEKRANDQAQILAQIAAQIVEPRTFTTDELARLRKAIGEPEFSRLWKTCLDVNQEVNVDSPFSPGSFGSGRS